MAKKDARQLQPIQADKIYPLPVFKAHAGLGSHAMRKARQDGLKTVKAGRAVFIHGRDFLDYLQNKAT